MSLTKKQKIIAAAISSIAVVWVILMTYSSWTVYIAPSAFDTSAPWLWGAGSALVLALLALALMRGGRISSGGFVRSIVISIAGAFIFGMGFMFAAYGVAALGAKLIPGEPVSQCYEVIHFPASRGVRLHLIDLETGYVHKLKYPSYLIETSISKGQEKDYARLVGTKTLFGINVERIEAAQECVQ